MGGTSSFGTLDNAQTEMFLFVMLVVVMNIMAFIMVVAKNSNLIGYLFAGLLMGPAVLDLVPHEFEHTIIIIGRLGVCLLILEAGMEMDIQSVKKNIGFAMILTVLSMVAPIGLVMATYNLLGLGTDITAGFAAGACFAATSVGMSAKILLDFKMNKSDVGQIIVTVAMIDDVLSLVVLAIVTQLTGTIDVWKVATPVISSVGFTLVLGFFAVMVNPRMVGWLRRWTIEFTSKKNPVEIKARVEQKLLFTSIGTTYIFMLSTLFAVLCAGGGTTELLGVFLAGVAFTEVEEAHHWWHKNFYMLTEMGAMFFFASLGFDIPLGSMLTWTAFGKGCIMTLPAVLGKVLPSVLVYLFKKAPLEGALIGEGLACWGEIAFFMTKVSFDSDIFGDHTTSEAKEVFAVLIWALLIGTCIMPILFPFLLKKYLASTGEDPEAREIEGDATRIQATAADIFVKTLFVPPSPTLGSKSAEITLTMNRKGLKVMRASPSFSMKEFSLESMPDLDIGVSDPLVVLETGDLSNSDDDDEEEEEHIPEAI